MTTAQRRVTIGVAVLLLGIQFVRPEKRNPPVAAERTYQARLQVPAEVASVVERSCYDCHSHQTRWPWYSEVAPVSWVVVNDVNHGRRHLNFSEWAQYDRKTADDLLGELCEVVTHGEMPLPSYRLVHRNARLAATEVRAICAWTDAERERLAQPGR